MTGRGGPFPPPLKPSALTVILLSTLSVQSPLLLSVYKNGERIDTIPLGKRRIYSFGRHSEMVDVCLDHPSLSRKHALLIHGTPTGSAGVAILDLGSGTGLLSFFIRSPVSVAIRKWNLAGTARRQVSGDIITIGSNRWLQNKIWRVKSDLCRSG